MTTRQDLIAQIRAYAKLADTAAGELEGRLIASGGQADASDCVRAAALTLLDALDDLPPARAAAAINALRDGRQNDLMMALEEAS